jgi:DNA-binding NarL/FixJ family response regulator
MIKVLIVDDHAFLRESLEFQLSKLEIPMHIDTAQDAKTALNFLKNHQPIDLILLDLALPDMDGFTCLETIRSKHPSCHVAILSAYDDNATICRAKAGGASGFISKRASSEDLLTAITKITQGQSFWANPLAADTFVAAEINRISPPIQGNGLGAQAYGFTKRQSDLLTLLHNGCSNREMAEKLGIGEGTVKTHLNAIFKTLGVSSRSQALATITRYKINLDHE